MVLSVLPRTGRMKNKLAIVSWNTGTLIPTPLPREPANSCTSKRFFLASQNCHKTHPNQAVFKRKRAALKWWQSCSFPWLRWGSRESFLTEMLPSCSQLLGFFRRRIQCRELARDAQHLTEQTPSDSTRTKRLQGQRDAENVNLRAPQTLSLHTARISH